MTFPEFAAARKVLLEEQVGVGARAKVQAENDKADATQDAIRKHQVA